MPRRAEFIFYLSLPDGAWNDHDGFQCPEGLNLFSIGVNDECKLYSDKWLVSMPRRAEFIFYLALTPIDRKRATISSFQCPEGLNLFSIS